jgi:hypothetical protein
MYTSTDLETASFKQAPPVSPGNAKTQAFQVVLVLCVLCAIGAVVLSVQQVLLQRSALTQEKEKARTVAIDLARTINAKLASLTPVATAIASDLSSGKLSTEAAPARLKRILEENPDLFEAGIAYIPFAKDPKRRLFSPHVAREGERILDFQLEDRYDYTTYAWFKDGLAAGAPHWGEPYFGGATKTLVVGYSAPFYRPGDSSRTPIGLVRTNLSLNQIHKIVSSLSLGQTGYGFLLSRKGVYLSDPVDEYAHNQRTIFDIARAHRDSGRQRLGEKAIAGQPAEEESISGVNDQPTWIFSQPVPEAGWSLGTVFMQNEVALEPALIRRGSIKILCGWMSFFFLLALLWFRRHEATEGSLWKMVVATGGLLIIGISFIWWLTLRYPDRNGEIGVHIFDEASLSKFLAQNSKSLSANNQRNQVKTGIFIRTMRFGTANDVSLTGQIWQRYREDPDRQFTPGFKLLDAESAETKEAYHLKGTDGDVIGWDFRATLRQPFTGAIKYPFDRAVVRIRIAPAEFYRNVTIIPDLDAYQLLAPSALPGTDKALVLPGWRLNQAYFLYSPANYGTNFGIETNLEQGRANELAFTLIAERQFLDPFISSVLPIIVVSCLLFGLLIVGSKQQSKVAATGFKATDVVRASVALLFPALIAQVNLRTKIGSSTIIYIEYFYFILYTAILGVSANALLFTLTGHGFSQYRDNLIPKLVFWPYLLGACFGVTILFLY